MVLRPRTTLSGAGESNGANSKENNNVNNVATHSRTTTTTASSSSSRASAISSTSSSLPPFIAPAAVRAAGSPVLPRPGSLAARAAEAAMKQRALARAAAEGSKTRGPSVRLAKLLLWMFLVHVASIYLFTRGFLLSRSVLDAKSECKNDNLEGDSPSSDCWYPQQYKKAVVVVIDALRFDFVVPHPIAQGEKEPYYINKLPVIHQLLKEKPENALVFQFVADPPTTTLQRLKALTTGTLPTFIDAGSNFASSALKEDNWLAQFEASRGSDRIRFMGDDTWMGLFPNALVANNSHSFPSLDVHDLHTLDTGVKEQLGPALENQGQWDLLIAHFLGVDHCGHTFGPDHPKMEQKLQEMNEQIEKIFKAVDKDTLVVIMGDHGMNSQGDHGGDSDDEVEAGLIVYSKRKLLNRKHLESLEHILHYSKPVGGKQYRTITQIDLVPTLSLLLGMPIPYNNLGAVIPELFLSAAHPVTAFKELLLAMRLNAAQVATYFQSYLDLNPTSDIALAMQYEFGYLFEHAESFFLSNQGLSHLTANQVVEALGYYSNYLRTALTSCKRIWAHFDLPLMAAGGGLLLFNCLCALLYILVCKSAIPTLMERFLAGGTLLGIFVSRVFKSFLFRMPLIQESSIGAVDVMVFSMGLFSIFGFLGCILEATQPWKHVTAGKVVKKLQSWVRLPPLSAFLACLFIFVNCLIFASNSYIVHESTFVVGFLQTFGLIGLLFSFRITDPKIRKRALVETALFMVLTRLASWSTICREEQGDLCTPTFYASATQAVPSQFSLILLVASGVLTPYLIRRMFLQTKSYNGVAVLWIDYGLRMGLVLGTIYAVLDFEGTKGMAARAFEPLVVGATTAPGEYLWLKNTLVRVAFGMGAIVGPFSWWTNPLCLDIQSLATPGLEVGDQATTNRPQGRTIYILGFANTFGSSYYILLTCVFLIISLTLKPMGAIMLSLGLAQITCLIDLVDLWRDADLATYQQQVVDRIETSALNPITLQEGQSLESLTAATLAGTSTVGLFEKPLVPPTPNLVLPTVVLSLLANLYFFATGHQAALSSIQWSAGFIGTPTLNFVVAPILITLNTLGPFMLCAAALPLVVLWMFAPKASGGTGPNAGQLVVFPQLTRVCLMMMLHQGLVLAANMFFTGGMFRRHLMVWKVFAPRFMLQAMTVLSMDLVLVVIVALVGLNKLMKEVSEALSIKIV